MVLKSVGVLSAGKIMCVLGAIGGLIGGAMIAIVSLLGGAAHMAQMQAQNAGGGNPAAPAAFLGIGAIIIMPIMYAIFGLIGGVIYAFIYNLAASIIGGLELNLEPKSL